MLIKKFRLHNGWKQSEVASMLGISERFYRSIESGEKKPSYKNLNKLEDLFGLPQRILLAESMEDVPIFYKNKFDIDM